MEILVMRSENEKRVLEYVEATDRDQQYQKYLHSKNKEADEDMRRQRNYQLENLYFKRREDVSEMQHERTLITKAMLKDQEKELRLKQKKAEEVRKREEEARLKKEHEKRENERRIREEYERRAAAEAAEVRKAEKLVKALEKKEREWMAKLRETQVIQETAFEQLENALQTDVINGIVNTQPGGLVAYGSGGISAVDSNDGFDMSSADSLGSAKATKRDSAASSRVVTKVTGSSGSVDGARKVTRAPFAGSGASLPKSRNAGSSSMLPLNKGRNESATARTVTNDRARKLVPSKTDDYRA